MAALTPNDKDVKAVDAQREANAEAKARASAKTEDAKTETAKDRVKTATEKTAVTKEIEKHQADPKDDSGYSADQLLYLMITANTPPQFDAAKAKAFEKLGRPSPIDEGYAIGSVTEYRGIEIVPNEVEPKMKDPDITDKDEAKDFAGS